jgi:hypothetical protein
MNSVIDLHTCATYPLDKALVESTLDFVWKAALRSGTVICEQPGLSSDHLPRDEVVQMEYVPTREGLPVVTCKVKLDDGERFVRYWTNLWSPKHQSTQRIYVLGVESRRGQHALLGFYPKYGRFVLSSMRPFAPQWIPETTTHLSPECIVHGGPGTNYIGWVHDGFGGTVLVQSKRSLVFASAGA